MAAAVLVGAWPIAPVAAPQKKDDKKQVEKAEQAQSQEIQALVKLVDGVQGGQPAPGDFALSWHAHFLKATEGKSYVPFTVSVEAGKLTAASVAMYLRVVKSSATNSPTGQASDVAPVGKGDKDKKDGRDDKKSPQDTRPEYPFEDVHFIEVKPPEPGQSPRFSRAFAVPAGPYDVYVALRERPAAAGGTAGAAKTAVYKQALTVPDFWTTDLTTSSVILADRVEPLETPLTREQQVERPYTIGATQIVPAFDTRLTKKDELSIVFLIYNAVLDASKKPDVMVEYNFHHRADGGEKFFNKTNPQEFSVKTLPPQFDSTVGHQLVAGQAVPLVGFAAGEYRLEIKVTDKASGKSLIHDVNFTVTAS